MDSKTLALLCRELADNRKGENIVILDVRELSSVTDYFVIASGTSEPHLRAITDEITEKLQEEYQVRPRAVDGTFQTSWVVLDFFDVIVHVMRADARERYNLEGLWGDAPQLRPRRKAKAKGAPASGRSGGVKYRLATLQDALLLGRLNAQLIEDEGHRSPLTVPQLTERMREWLAAVYTGIIFEDEAGVIAYALFQEEAEQIYLRQFLVVRGRRRTGQGRAAMMLLFREIWPRHKRLSVSVLADNQPARAFWRAVGYTEYSLTLEISPANRASA